MPSAIVVSRDIAAPPGEVYAILADYHRGHPAILPRPPFTDLVVERGGVGAGTVIRVTMRVMGRSQAFRATITEPEPGRILEETADTGYVTRFFVEPSGDGRGARVTIHTVPPARRGPGAWLERWLVRRLLEPTYHRELDLLARAVAGGEP